MSRISRALFSIISGFGFVFWVIGLVDRNFLLTLISGVCFILFLVLAVAKESFPPPPPPEDWDPPPPPPDD
jgi:hypothetical protein